MFPAFTEKVNFTKAPPNRKRRGQRPKSPLKFDTVQIFSSISYWKKAIFKIIINFIIITYISMKIWTVWTVPNFRGLFGLRPRSFPFCGTLFNDKTAYWYEIKARNVKECRLKNCGWDSFPAENLKKKNSKWLHWNLASVLKLLNVKTMKNW